MKKIYFFLFVSIGLLFSANVAKASHIAGGDINYVCLGNNQYQINLNLFVDCLGFDPGASQTITFTSTCGGSATATVNVTNPGGTEISQLCPSQLNNSTCNGGTLPGMWVFSYTGVVTLSPTCNTWNMSWTTCCRNNAIENLTNPGSLDSYIEATMNSATDSCNTSPSFTSQPIPYVCINQAVNYSYGVVETDGDSLYYSLVNALGGGGTLLTYDPGYTASVPIPGIAIDPLTGQLTFTPTLLGNFVVVVMVQEYDSNGNLLGTTMRDIQFIVQNCTNGVPSSSGGAISNLNGTAVQTSPYALELCEGSSFSFNAVYTDVDPSDSLSIVTNLLSVLPGATITTSGANPLTATITWTAPVGSANTNTSFSITINDGACPIQGQQTFVYDINVLPRTSAGADRILCGVQTAQLAASGGSVFTWSVISGPPLVVGTNFSCNPCANPVASPSSTTTYEVTSNLSGTCINKDTVTITIVPDYSFTVSQSATNTCLLQPINLNVSVNPTGNYTYSWTPGNYLNNPNSASPVAIITTPGTYSYTVNVTSPQGCVKTDTVSIITNPSYPPAPASYIYDSVACNGEITNLGVLFGTGLPTTCNLTTSGPCAATIQYQAGNGTLTTNAYPTPYASFWHDGRVQMLYRASELSALGMTGGKISSVGFNITTKGSTAPFNGFTIKMKCTPLTSLSGYQTGMTTVYGPITTTTAVGWNTYNFPTAYEWDGLSNIIVEVCYDNTAYTQNDVVQKTATAFNSVILQYTDGAVGCNLNAPTTYTERPNIRFEACGGQDTASYTYSWTPSSSVTNPTGQFTSATVNGSTTYTLIVTNSTSGCADTSTFNITGTSPSVSFVASPSTGFYPLNVQFTNTSSANTVNVIWNFGDTISGANNTSTQFDPTHVYAQEGTYTVTLVGVDANGCTDTATAIIEVTGQSALFIPNVFTPGGLNPLYKVAGVNITDYSIQIFDRWGVKVYESGDINNSWTGGDSKDGTYFYVIKAKGVEGKEFDEKGYLQLIRK